MKCKFFETPGGCLRGKNCPFSHETQNLGLTLLQPLQGNFSQQLSLPLQLCNIPPKSITNKYPKKQEYLEKRNENQVKIFQKKTGEEMNWEKFNPLIGKKILRRNKNKPRILQTESYRKKTRTEKKNSWVTHPQQVYFFPEVGMPISYQSSQIVSHGIKNLRFNQKKKPINIPMEYNEIIHQGIDPRNICQYYLTKEGCRYGKSCFKYHFKESIKLAKWMLNIFSLQQYVHISPHYNFNRFNDLFNTIEIYSFDGVLFDTVFLEEGLEIFRKEKGFEWPFPFFYNHVQSLQSFKHHIKKGPLFDRIKTNEKNVLKIILTGRSFGLKKQILDTMRRFGGHVPIIMMMPLNWKCGSKLWKCIVIDQFLKFHFPKLKNIRIFDSDKEEMTEMKYYGEKNGWDVQIFPVERLTRMLKRNQYFFDVNIVTKY